MPQISDLIESGRLKKLLEFYSSAFNTSIVVLDLNRKIVMEGGKPAGRELAESPLHLRDEIAGYIAFPKEDSHVPVELITGNIAEITEMGYEIESLSGEVARIYEEISMIWKLTSRLGATLNVNEICNILADEVMTICPSRNVSVMLIGEMPSGSSAPACIRKGGAPLETIKPLFFPKATLGVDANRASTMAFSSDRGLLGHVYSAKEPITVCDVSKDERFEGFPYSVTRILVVPLVAEDSVIGLIVANDKLNGEEYFTTEIKLVHSIASECATSIKRALLYEEVNSMLFSTAESFSLAMDAKDPYTYGHSKRVSEISAAIAHEMGFSPETVGWIRLAALLHDIGKIGTPENILHKDERLSDDEMARIKDHPVIGAKMIEHVYRMKEIARWLCHHHERYDGKGYPSGLEGEDIPVPSRIIAIADYYDALTTDRPYRKAYDRQKAVEMMRDILGKHLDPVIFDHFVKAVL